eukprot:CAMPEP_0182899154 /NCGR_PEP_ID=MMETSP0034_2-20130328/27902_1 /TAXON_ID=156128 /ORGANISM="Nephroselmis pyriformis, Strain CCMP717" /LENGTH=460 /DNA_ID=CAMNT_0025033161 /DNA_START=210 /DNA_END=1589 /DNA_ORIENTATION=-
MGLSPEVQDENTGHWIPDAMSKVCYHCDAAFTVLLRRHHCRVCGHLFCWKCSHNTIALRRDDGTTATVRICDFCLELRKATPSPSSLLEEPAASPVGGSRPRGGVGGPRGPARSLNFGSSSSGLWVLPPASEAWMDACDHDPEEAEWGALDSLPPAVDVGGGCPGGELASDYRRALRQVADQHLRALALQLLRQEQVPGADTWAPTVHRLAVEAAMTISPAGAAACAQPHPNFYIKVKRAVPLHAPGESGAAAGGEASAMVPGVVCRKNVTHRRMPRALESPRILLLRGAIEYQRSPAQLSCMDTLLDQEAVHLDLLVRRVMLYSPSLVLVERSVAGPAQDRLGELGVVLAVNVKARLLRRVARCTGASILSVPEQLGVQAARLGTCRAFRLESHPDATRRGVSHTLMFFEGCPRPLGCTIVLRGSDRGALARVKRVAHFMSFSAYAQRLETSFLAELLA